MCAGKVFIQQENLATLQKETFFNIHSKTKCRWLTMVSVPNVSSPESDHKGWMFYLKVHLWPGCKEHILPGFSGQGTGNCANATTEESIVHFKFKRGCNCCQRMSAVARLLSDCYHLSFRNLIWAARNLAGEPWECRPLLLTPNHSLGSKNGYPLFLFAVCSLLIALNVRALAWKG